MYNIARRIGVLIEPACPTTYTLRLRVGAHWMLRSAIDHNFAWVLSCCWLLTLNATAYLFFLRATACGTIIHIRYIAFVIGLAIAQHAYRFAVCLRYAFFIGIIEVDHAVVAGFDETALKAVLAVAHAFCHALVEEIVAGLNSAGGCAGLIFRAMGVALHWTEVWRTPTDIDALLRTGVRIGGHRRTQAFAIASLVAGARIEYATFQVLLNRHFSVAILKYFRF